MVNEILVQLYRMFLAAAAWLLRAVMLIYALVLLTLGIFILIFAALGGPPSWMPSLGLLLDPNLVGALGNLLLGLAALYIGGRLRKHQEIEAEARAKLALNVELRSRAVLAGEHCILEVIVEVHNISRATWFVPIVHLSVKSALDGQEIPLNRKFSNIAWYPATLCQLQPDERDQFFATLNFDLARSQALSAVLVEIVVASTSAKWLGSREATMDFVEFMDTDDGARHKYFCIKRCKEKEHSRYGRRCFIYENGSIDEESTWRYRNLLDDNMLWSREQIVGLVGPKLKLKQVAVMRNDGQAKIGE